jgi:hypothetical protein
MSDAYKTITLNSKMMGVNAESMSYEQAVELSQDAQSDPAPVFTVTYRSKTGASAGTLAPGESTELFDGMVFNVVITNNG